MNANPSERLVEATRFVLSKGDKNKIEIINKPFRSLGSIVYSGPGRHHEMLGEIGRNGTVMVIGMNSVWA